MLGLIVALTVPIGRPNRDPHWLDAHRFGARRMVADGVLNVALFVPLGWALHRLVRASGVPRAMLIVALGTIGLSVGLETAQYFLTYRFSSLPDVVTNAAGGIVGAVIDRVLNRG